MKLTVREKIDFKDLDKLQFTTKEEVMERLKNKGFNLSEDNTLDYLRCIDMWDEYKTLTNQQ